MNTIPLRKNLLGGAVLAALLLAAPQAVRAQDAEAAKSDDDKSVTLDALVVTGSRIKNKNLFSTTPVTVVTPESLKLSGTLSVEEHLNTLPQLVAGNTKSSNVFGDSDATSTLNLRGLGGDRSSLSRLKAHPGARQRQTFYQLRRQRCG